MGAAVNASRSGDLLNDTYELCELVESRDTHQLYSARDTRNDRLVHVALLRPEVALRKGVAQSFVKAPTALSKIDHPNVSRVWSVETDGTGIPFVVEEPRSGQALTTMLESFTDGIPLGVAMNLLVPVVEAMGAAHGRGLVHGSIDASRIVLTEHAGTTVPKLFGFGANDRATVHDDVHALGALFYRALSGQAAGGKRHTPLDELAPHLPLELTELIERCLASEDERPADARLLSDELSTLRQRLGGNRVSAVSTERVVSPVVTHKEPAPVAAPAPAVKAVTKDESARRRAIERAATAPVEPPPVDRPSEPVVEVKIDPHGATFVDQDPPVLVVEAPPQAQASAAPVPGSLDRSSIDFPMASMRPDDPPRAAATAPKPAARAVSAQAAQPAPKLQHTPKSEAPTKVDAPEETREARGKAKPRKAGAKAKAEAPAGIAVAGPARLAAAFAPLEGADNIQQGETHEAELGRAFRQQQDNERAAREARFARGSAEAALEASMKASAQNKAKPAPTGQAAAPQGKREPARMTAAEVIALSQVQAQEEAKRERRSRIIGGFFLMLFGVLLARAVPLLTAGKEQAEAVLGAHVNGAALAFTALSTIVLIRTWALQIQTKALLLKPVTYSLKLVVVCTAILSFSMMMDDGGLGMIAGAARRFLPWGSAAFFMFLGFYGMMRGIRETQANAIAGIAMTLAYGGSFIGSYSIAHNVIMPSMRGKHASLGAMQAMMQRDADQDPNALLENSGLDPEVAADIKEQATAEDGFQEVHMAGGNEEEDMKSIREMGDARKRNSEKLKDLKDKLPELTK